MVEGNGGFSGFPNMGSLGLGLKMMQDNQSSGGSDTQEENLLFGDKEPEDLIREGYSVKDLIKAGVKSKDIPLYNHIKKGEGVARGSKPGVKGAHNMDAFFESIEKDAKRLGLNTSDYNIEKTPHPTVKGLYEMKYVVPKKNGLGKPKYDANGVLKTRLAYDVKTVYDPKVFSDSDIYDMGRKALNPEISKISIGTREKIHGEINGIKFEGTVNIHGKLTTFYPIFD